MARVQDNERSKPQQERSIRAYEAILDAADELFGDQGFQETQMSQIIERSGVRAGSLYRFFADKRDIGLAIIDRESKSMGYMGDMLPTAETLEETLVLADAVVDVVIQHQRDNPGYRAITTELNDTKDPSSKLREIRHIHIDALVGMVSVVADHLEIDERRRIVMYGSEILEGLVRMGPYAGESHAAHVAEIKKAVRAYLAAALTPD